MLKRKALYDVDFNLWVAGQVSALKSDRTADLDLPNLIEEIEDLAKRDKQALRNDLQVLLMQLLKWQYQPNKRRVKSWKVSITRSRFAIEDLLSDSPSLRNYLPTVIDKSYDCAKTLIEDETGLDTKIFPTDCPYTIEQALDLAFLPE